MKRRTFLKRVGCTTFCLPICGAVAANTRKSNKKKPNIVYLFSDQQRNHSRSELNPQVSTPNMERMAREGVCFDNCISTYPLCSPYRASLFTGQYPQVHGVMGNVNTPSDPLIPTETETIAERLAKNGYVTGYVGKWHLYAKGGNPGNGKKPHIVPEGPHRHGFDDYWRVCYNYVRRYDTRYLDDSGQEHVLPEYAPKNQMDLAFDFIGRNKDRPFCVFVSWHPPHAPFPEAPERFAKLYRDIKLNVRPNASKSREKDVKGYFAHISALDDEIGRTIEKLKTLGIDDNTIVVYTSDHGEMLGSHRAWGKRLPWEESINVPFFIRWPAGIPGNRKLNALLSTVDIAPTLLGLTGVAVPDSMQGTDLSRLLLGKEMQCPDSALIMSTSWCGVRTKQYTYARKGLEPWLLFDNKNDPYQLNNLIENKEHSALLDKLDKDLAVLLKKAKEQ